MATGKALNGKPYAGNPHVRFDEGEVASCTAEASLRRVHCRRQPEGRASVCAATPRRESLLYTQIIRKIVALVAVAGSATTLFGSTLYVTPTGAGNKDGSDWANAFAGIQAAVDAADAAYAADGTLHDILVADGTYTRVVVSRDFALQVRSQNGATSTIIDGYGTNNCVDVRLSGWTDFGRQPTFTGFTLRNGDVRSLRYDRGGGAGGGTLVDCVIEDCRAWMGGGTYQANTMRCIIRRCSAPPYQGGIVYGGNHVNDLMYGNSRDYALVCNASLYSCTVADNAASSS